MQTLAPSGPVSCLGGDGVKLTRFTVEFGDGAGMRGKWSLPSCRENCISNPAAQGLDSASCGPWDWRGQETLGSCQTPGWSLKPFLEEAQAV